MALLDVPRLGDSRDAGASPGRRLRAARGGAIVAAAALVLLVALLSGGPRGLAAGSGLALLAAAGAFAFAGGRIAGAACVSAASASWAAFLAATAGLGVPAFAWDRALSSGAAFATMLLGLFAAVVLLAAAGLVVRSSSRGLDAGSPAGRLRWTSDVPASLVVGLAAPALASADAVAAAWPVGGGRVRERLRLAATVEELRAGFGGLGWESSVRDGGVQVESAGGEIARLRTTRLRFPPAAHGGVLEVAGGKEAVRAVRDALEGPLLGVGLRAWSRTGVRIERRVHALLAAARLASGMEEQGILLDEVRAISAAVAARRLPEEERTLLVAWKARAAEGAIASRALGGGGKGASLAPAPTLLPDLGVLAEAGGLGRLRDVVFAPVWILAGPHGLDDAVDALERRLLPDAGRLLEALEARDPTWTPPAPGAFLPPAPASEVVRAPGAGHLRAEGALLVYVPFLPDAEGAVNLVTGARRAPLPVLPRATLPPGTLVA